MSLNGFFYDGKAKSGSLFILAPGQVCLVEALPDLVQLFSGDADSVIFDGDIGLVYLTTNPEITRKAIESVAEKTVPESLDFFSEEERYDLLSFLDSLG